MMQFLQNLVFRDFWLKLFSLALAVVIWFVFSFTIQRDVSPVASLSLNIKERTYYSLPVLVMSTASDVKNFRVNPSEVEVTVRGDVRLLRGLQPKDIRVIVDLTGIEEARDLRKRIDVSTPAGITHVSVFPQEVEVVIPPKKI